MAEILRGRFAGFHDMNMAAGPMAVIVHTEGVNQGATRFGQAQASSARVRPKSENLGPPKPAKEALQLPLSSS